jgi:hypothetical protein
MRSNALASIVLVFSLLPVPAQAQKLTNVIARLSPSQTDVIVYVDFSGSFSAAGANAALWKLSATEGTMSALIDNASTPATGKPPIRNVAYNATTEQVEITIDTAALGAIDPARAGWTVVFLEGQRILTVASAAADAPLRFKPAKNKDDADLYVSGGVLAGPATKPIWMVDAKGAIGWPMGQTFHWMGAIGTFQVNPDAKPPADSGDANPDSISLYAQMDRLWPVEMPLIYGIQGVLRPIGGEFGSDPRTGNFMTAGQVAFLSDPVANAFVIDPVVGYEIGSNRQKPDKLFDRQVDLSGYDDIRRLLIGVSARYYVFQQKITTDSVYRLVLSFSWTGRFLGTDEPFVRSQFIPNEEGIGKRQKVLELNDESRHFVEASAAWNASPLIGLEWKYTRGSQPPLFQYVDQQFSFAVAFKTKFGNDLRAP